MTYFSGFSLAGEAELFDEFLAPWRENPYTVAGFSYGAQKALEHVLEMPRRVDRLLLLSPAWFLDKKPAFIKLQLRAFAKDKEGYLRNFLASAAYPSPVDLAPYLAPGTAEELEALLTYPWESGKLEALRQKGVRLEVYLGGRDRIVDAAKAHEFFKNYGESWLFKAYGHLLQGEKEHG
ncbi:pimelyl-ACP methyl ester esterase BioV [Hydrogenimonas sp.]